MMILTAEKNPLTTVWLNGRDVSGWAVGCKVPEKPGRIGLGWVDTLVCKRESKLISVARVDADGNLIIRRKYGCVKWMPTDN